MTLTTNEMTRLEQDGRSMFKSHRTYLVEAQRALGASATEGDAVLGTLELLCALFGSGFASRPNERQALNDVGRWLERRISREPGVSAARLALELGWLKRLTQGKADQDERATNGPKEKVGRGFGDKLVELAEKRRKALAAKSRQEKAAEAPETKPDTGGNEPIELPAAFVASFINPGDARDAKKAASKRRRDGKALRDRALPVQPSDGKFAALAKGIVVSVLRTEGFEPLLEHQGSEGTPFLVDGVETLDDGSRVARRIHALPPKLRK